MNGRDYDVLIHFGAPKTGTTAIQKFCLENRRSLEKCGFYYPDHPLDSNGISAGHTWFSKRVLDGKVDVAAKMLDDFAGKARKKQCTLLISSEALYGKAAEVYRCLQGYRVGVVGWFRDPVSFFVSNYMQGVKRHGQKKKLHDFCAGFLEGEHPYLDGSFVHDWADTFGDENCTIREYHRSYFNARPIEHQFLEGIGVHEGEWARFARNSGFVNRGYTEAALEAKRLFNQVIDEPQSPLDKRLDVLLQKFSDGSDVPHWRVKDKLSADLYDSLNRKFSRKVEALKERFPGLLLDIHEDDDVGLDKGVADYFSQIPVILEYVRNNDPKAFEEIVDGARSKLGAGKSSYPFLKLADLLGLSFSEPDYGTRMLQDRARRVLADKKSQSADYLREFALYLERCGAPGDALRVVDQALTMRPQGQGLKHIRARLFKKVAASRGQGESGQVGASQSAST